jgi:hypothetical protein
MGYRTDLIGRASHSEVQSFLRRTCTHLSLDNQRLSIDDILLPEYHPSVARVLDHARACPFMEQPHSPKRARWMDDNISRVGLDQWLSNRLHVADDLLDAFPGFKLLRPRHLDCLMTAGIELPTDEPIIANVNGSTQYLSISEGHFPTITPKGIFFLCDRVRQPYLIFLLSCVHYLYCLDCSVFYGALCCSVCYCALSSYCSNQCMYQSSSINHH